MKRIVLIFFITSLCFFIQKTFCAEPSFIPESLEPWKNWVLEGYERQQCPTPYNQNKRHHCVWPTQLTLNISDTQAQFELVVTNYAAGWVPLPGNAQLWPQHVQIHNQAIAVVRRNQLPYVFLEKGEFQITGQFTFNQQPDFIPLPSELATLVLTINGQTIAQPFRDKQSKLWLRNKGAGESSLAEENTLSMRVYRFIEDDIPLINQTRIILQVGGQPREMLIGPVLQPKTEPMAVHSVLPVQIEDNGMLRVQLQAGQHQITVKSRYLGNQKKLSMIPHAAPWPKEEIWIFKPNVALRAIDIEGGTAIDPQQSGVPTDFQGYPSYLMKENETLTFIEKQRGAVVQADNLHLQRTLWLDFSGKGYTVQDNFSGQIFQHWRLSQQAPYQLKSATNNGEPQPITHLKNASQSGLEIRQGHLNLNAMSRINSRPLRLPLLGWNIDVKTLAATLYLPPGWLLLSTFGVDKVEQAWIQSWTLLDLFIVLIMSVAVFKLFGLRWGVVTFITMGLIYQELNAPVYTWLNLIAVIALLKVLPNGRAKIAAKGYLMASFAVLVIIALPFMVQQIRSAIYPQLEVVNRYPVRATQLVKVHQRLSTKKLEATGVSEMAQVPASTLDSARNLMAGNAFETQQETFDNPIEEYDPDLVIQTGPGVPMWQWQRVDLSWSGPVLTSQTLQLWLIPSWMYSILKVLQVMLIGLLLYIFSRPFHRTWGDNIQSTKVTASTLKSVWPWLLLPLFFCCLSGNSYAQFPDKELLDELRHKLLKPALCAPTCADISKMQIQVSGNHMSMRLQAQMASRVAIPVPANVSQWMPRTILIDNQAATALRLDNQGKLWIDVPAGVHEILLEGSLENLENFELEFLLSPHQVLWQTDGWKISGLQNQQLQGSSLYFQRLESASIPSSSIQSDLTSMKRIPSFVLVEKHVQIGLDWKVVNELKRLAPQTGAIQVTLDLLDNERVISDNVQIKDRQITVLLGETETSKQWLSKLTPTSTITLTASNNLNIKEIWKLSASNRWHCDFAGVPEILQQQHGQWLPTWQPWPNEQVVIGVTQPLPVKGQTLSIDASHLQVLTGRQASENALELTIRSTQGNNHPIQIPREAVIQRVLMDEVVQNIEENSGKIILPIYPGEHRYRIDWKTPVGIRTILHDPAINLNSESSNSFVDMRVGNDRWILWLTGSVMGPSLLFWGYLAVLALLAIALAKTRLTPLTSWQWIVLGIGVTLASPLALVFIVSWFIAMTKRKELAKKIPHKWFNFTQFFLIVLSIAFIVSLFSSISVGLLGAPNMQIHHPQNYLAYTSRDYLPMNAFRWYQDLTMNTLPRCTIISVPLYVYRFLMLVWALWLAFALIKWVRWGWSCFTENGYWQRNIIKK